MVVKKVKDLHQGFRQNYLDFAALEEQLRLWAASFPEFVRLSSIGTSQEGRELWLVTIGKNPDVVRPAVWVDGNMHASEVCGSNAALTIAEDVLMLLAGQETDSSVLRKLGPEAKSNIQNLLFYILPRMSPDGAETVLKKGRYVRSSPVNARKNKNHPHWRAEDLDGDGIIRLIRMQDPTGELATHPDYPEVLIPRFPEDQGPFYKVFPEGLIENYNGLDVPTPGYLDDNSQDFNRNFPWSWMPEPKQSGAGEYPGSAAEVKAVMDFAVAHPNIFFWLNFHTFGGVLIRPPSHLPDKKLNQADLAVYRQIERWSDQLTGYPMVNGFEEFCYEPDTPLYGDATDFAYHQRGCLTYVVEIWDIFKRLGHERKKPFIEHYFKIEREDFGKLAELDRTANKNRIFGTWKKFKHPQLGDIEIGGVDPRIGINNPWYEEIDEICSAQSALALRVAGLAPLLSFGKISLVKHGDATTVTAEIINTGYLATYITETARLIPINEDIRIDAESANLEIVSQTTFSAGQLQGYGRGLFNDLGALFLPKTKGSVSSKKVQFTVIGNGTLNISAGNCRLGKIAMTIEV